MPGVRHTPPRRRAACPECGRDTAYSTHYETGLYGLANEEHRIFANHKNPETGEPCKGSGGLGYPTARR